VRLPVGSVFRSRRFAKPVRLTLHARERMAERGVETSVIVDLIETGTIKRKDGRRFWIYKEVTGRDDNLVCAAVVDEDILVVKTIMTHWQESEP
jgi:hypothetical protein